MSDPTTRRSVTAEITADVVAGDAGVALAIAVADGHPAADERLSVRLDGRELAVRELTTIHGGRLTVVEGIAPGRLEVEYAAEVVGDAPDTEATELDRIRYLRPSRYCESDRLGPLARSEFAGLVGRELLFGVSSWVGENVEYVPGSSRPTDGALNTLLARSGVCRDFAHLTAALLRANNVPARVAAVYAPGLEPMDFHAVAEACVDGRWWVVDPTCLAPRQTMVRIATGADASETAFLTILRGAVELDDLTITAVAADLPRDDVDDLVALR